MLSDCSWVGLIQTLFELEPEMVPKRVVDLRHVFLGQPANEAKETLLRKGDDLSAEGGSAEVVEHPWWNLDVVGEVRLAPSVGQGNDRDHW